MLFLSQHLRWTHMADFINVFKCALKVWFFISGCFQVFGELIKLSGSWLHCSCFYSDIMEIWIDHINIHKMVLSIDYHKCVNFLVPYLKENKILAAWYFISFNFISLPWDMVIPHSLLESCLLVSDGSIILLLCYLQGKQQMLWEKKVSLRRFWSRVYKYIYLWFLWHEVKWIKWRVLTWQQNKLPFSVLPSYLWKSIVLFFWKILCEHENDWYVSNFLAPKMSSHNTQYCLFEMSILNNNNN